MNEKTSPDGCQSIPVSDRRRFLQISSAALMAAASPQFVHAAPTPTSYAETIVTEFYKSLSASQKVAICRDFSHPDRTKADASWHVTEPMIGTDFYTLTQRVLIKEIVRSVTNEEGYARILRQTADDEKNGLDEYTVGIFGNPNTDKFQWLLTGRHLTLRADGNAVDNYAFGGPIIYGHGRERARENAFFYQTKIINELYGALNKDQASRALLPVAPRENDIQPQGKNASFPGLPVSEMSADQKGLVKSTLEAVLGPYRAEDSHEALALIDQAGGIDSLTFAFYSQEDLDDDKMWDIWRIEGPNAVINFRGSPHVHAYINIGGVSPS